MGIEFHEIPKQAQANGYPHRKQQIRNITHVAVYLSRVGTLEILIFCGVVAHSGSRFLEINFGQCESGCRFNLCISNICVYLVFFPGTWQHLGNYCVRLLTIFN